MLMRRVNLVWFRPARNGALAVSARCLVALLLVQPGVAQQAAENSNASIAGMKGRAIAYLKSYTPGGENLVGECALIAYALQKAGVPASDPYVARLLLQLSRQAEGGTYQPGRAGGVDNYEAGLFCMALAEADADRYRSHIESAAKYLISKQASDGPWDYANGRTGDTSMTQMALLGLWAAAAAGVEIPQQVWDRAAYWLVTRQDPSGGFSYHPEPPLDGQLRPQRDVRHSMTAGGVGSLYICRSQLPFQDKQKGKGVLKAGARSQEQPPPQDLLVSAQQMDRAIERGTSWLNQNFTMTRPIGYFHYYYYSLERFAAFAGLEEIGGRDWYREGVDYLRAAEQPRGGWFEAGREPYSQPIQTGFALLFLVKATHGKLQGPDAGRLGSGTLIAGRGLPDDLSLLSIQRGKLVQPALKLRIEEFLNLLARGQIQQPVNLELAQEASSDSLQELMRLAGHRDAQVRHRALWSLGRLGRYEAVPALIEALRDPDASVARAAHESLRFLSRKPDASGLSLAPTEAEIQAAVQQWQKWYRSVRSYDEFETP